VVLSREEVDQIFRHLQGTMWLVVALLDGGVRGPVERAAVVSALDAEPHFAAKQ
jgi:hypothetical protein